MATCARCNPQESQILEYGQSLCTGCTIRERLTQDVLEKTFEKSEAVRRFDALMIRFPTGAAEADGIEQIKSASKELALARKDMVRAYSRLADYIDRGVVPEDLKEKAIRASASAA